MASATLNYLIPYPQNTDSVDVAGDIQNLAEHLDQNLNEIIADNVGLMVQSNSESGISVIYNDVDNTLDFTTNSFNINLINAVSGSATVTGLSNTNISTVAKNFNIVLSGDVSASATVTNLSNTELIASVNDDSHYHTPSTLYDLFLSDIQDFEQLTLQDGDAVVYNSQSAIWTNDIPGRRLFVAEYPSSITVQRTDVGKTIELNSSSAITVTIPNSASATLPNNSYIAFVRKGSGSVTFVPGNGVIINSLNGNLSISGRYGKAEIYKTDTNTWILTGDLS